MTSYYDASWVWPDIQFHPYSIVQFKITHHNRRYESNFLCFRLGRQLLLPAGRVRIRTDGRVLYSSDLHSVGPDRHTILGRILDQQGLWACSSGPRSDHGPHDDHPTDHVTQQHDEGVVLEGDRCLVRHVYDVRVCRAPRIRLRQRLLKTGEESERNAQEGRRQRRRESCHCHVMSCNISSWRWCMWSWQWHAMKLYHDNIIDIGNAVHQNVWVHIPLVIFSSSRIGYIILLPAEVVLGLSINKYTTSGGSIYMV